MKRFVSALLAGAIVLMSMPMALAVDDLKGHWAKEYITYMNTLEIMKPSSDGSFKPDQTVTRAEFMRYMNRAFHFTEKTEINYDDVPQLDSNGAQTWYYEPIQIAVKYGYINGVGHNNMDPLGNVTREQAATIIGRLHKYAPTTDTSNVTFTDKKDIGNWSIQYIADAVRKGYLGGYPDGSFKPAGTITRAELAKLLYQFMGTSLNTAGGSYTEGSLRDSTDNVTICEPCTLSNAKIDGDLYITEGVLDGYVTLENVNVSGNIIIAGGVVEMNGTTTNNLVVSSPVGRLIQVTATGNTNIGTTEVQSNATLCESALNEGAGGFSDITITGETVPALTLEGDVWDVTADQKASITTTSATTINTLTANAAVNVSGYGTIRKAVLNASGCSIAMQPGNVQLASGVSATIAGQSTVSENEVSISPSTATYDIGSDTSLYLDFTCINVDHFSKLLSGTTALKENTDYRITDNGFRLYTTWIKKLSVGTYPLTVTFDDGTTGAITLKVVDSDQSALEISSVTFDKYTSADKYANISIPIALATGATLDSVKIASKTLTRGDDYTYNPSTHMIVLQKEFLATLSTGNYTILCKLNKGSDLKCALSVEDSSPKNELSVTEMDFDANASSGGYTDLTVTLSAANGAKLDAITCNDKTLELDWQYMVNGDKITISKTALSNLAGKSKEDYLDLTFDMSSGVDPVLRVNLVTTYALGVSVLDDLEAGLEGVTVTVTPSTTDGSLSAAQTASTGLSGELTFYVKRGTYTVTASGGELSEPLSRTVTLSGTKQTVTFTAVILQTVKIYVVNTSGAALPGATVMMGGQTVTTDTAGVATFEIARGSYTVRATGSGKSASTTITVSGDTTERIKLDS